MEKTILILIVFGVCGFIHMFLPFWIKNRIIKNCHSRQINAIQSQTRNTLKVATQPKHVEFYYSYVAYFSAAGFISTIFLFIGLYSYLFEGNGKQIPIIKLSLLLTAIMYLADLAIFYIRRALGIIQGAIVFDPEEKKIYAFPSVKSDYYLGEYKEYHESDLVYTTESYAKHRGSSETAYVFFTKGERNYAFKVGDLQKNNFGKMLSHDEQDIDVPYKHRFHFATLFLISIILALQSAIHSLP